MFNLEIRFSKSGILCFLLEGRNITWMLQCYEHPWTTGWTFKKDSCCLWNKTFTDNKHHFSYWKISCHLECFSQNQLGKLSSFVAQVGWWACSHCFPILCWGNSIPASPVPENGEVSLHVSRLKNVWSTNHPFWIIFCIPVVLCFFFW